MCKRVVVGSGQGQQQMCAADVCLCAAHSHMVMPQPVQASALSTHGPVRPAPGVSSTVRTCVCLLLAACLSVDSVRRHGGAAACAGRR
jgi:hypothetical protein